LIFWSDKPVSLPQIKTWLGKSGADASIWRAVQPVYIGANVEADPYKGKRWGKLDGAPSVTLPDNLPEQPDDVTTYDRPKLAVEGAKIDAPYMLEKWTSVVASRTAERVAEDGRRNSFRLAALDGHNRALSAETLETLIGLWFAPDDEDAHAEAVAVLNDLGADTAIADRLATAGRAVDWEAGEPLGPDHIAAQIKSAFATAQSPFGSAYKSEIGEKFGAVDESETFDAAERLRERSFDAMPTDSDIDALRKALVADGASHTSANALCARITALTPGDVALDALDALVDEAITLSKSPASGKPGVLKTFSQFKAEYAPARYLIEGLVQAARLLTLTGRTGHGKTQLLILIALALATGRKDILGVEVKRTRIIYATYENAEDFRTKLVAAAHAYEIADATLDGWLSIVDANLPPERLGKQVKKAEAGALIVDTMQAAFDGKDANDNREMLAFVRRFRPISENEHRTTVLIAAHPVKNATKDNLLPYGAGSVVNEVDGNFTLWRDEAGVAEWSWQGKFRGAHFEPRAFKIETRAAESLLDEKGRALMLPVMSALDGDEKQKLQAKASNKKDALLLELATNPERSIRELASAAGLGKSTADDALKLWAKQGITEKDGDKWKLTDKGRAKAAEIAPGGKTEPDFACVDDNETA
jgi:KaiC/GvpD/RAD55 family RecA-like ATPase